MTAVSEKMTSIGETALVISEILGTMKKQHFKLTKVQINEAVSTNQIYQRILDELQLVKAEMTRYNDHVRQTSLV